MSKLAPRARRRMRIVALFAIGGSMLTAACGWDPSRPFDRNSPVVGEAISLADAGDASGATTVLEDYLQTGACTQGSIGAPFLIHQKPNGAVDLGLTLFKVAEGYGQRFGDEEDGGLDQMKKAVRGGDIECALKVLRAIAEDTTQDIGLRARARFIEGNLLFLDAQYKEAVKAYDEALTLAPGMFDAGDAIGRDAAWNRAIALRRIEDQKDAGRDAQSDAQDQDSGPPPDGGGGDGGGNGEGGNQSPDGGGNDDQNKDGGGNDERPDAGPSKNDTPPPSMDDRVLDKLENAPTVQQEAAKKQGQKKKVRVMQDK